jgi:hypothetical protein
MEGFDLKEFDRLLDTVQDWPTQPMKKMPSLPSSGPP